MYVKFELTKSFEKYFNRTTVSIHLKAFNSLELRILCFPVDCYQNRICFKQKTSYLFESSRKLYMSKNMESEQKVQKKKYRKECVGEGERERELGRRGFNVKYKICFQRWCLQQSVSDSKRKRKRLPSKINY